MKKILFSIIISCIALCACDRTVIDGELDFGLAGETTIKIIENNSTFSPDGGVGFLIIDSESGFKARSDRAWCSLSVEKDSVTLSVEPYDGMDSRYAAVVVKNEAGDSVNVIVHQFGAVIQSIDASGAYCNNEGGNVLIAYKANMTPKVVSSVDWAVPTLVEGGIDVAFSKNVTGSFRKGYIACTLGPESYEIPVAQLDSTDILGVKNWEFFGVQSVGDTLKLAVTITRKMTGYGVKFTGTDISWSYDAKVVGNKFAIPLGTSIGRYKPASVNYYVIPVVAEGTDPLNAGDGIDTGYFFIPLDKASADAKWEGKVENANLRFDFWTLASRTSPSEGGFRFNDVIIKQF